MSTFNAFAVSPDGSEVFTTSVSGSPSRPQGYDTVAYDPATGAVLWQDGVNKAGDYHSYPLSMVTSPDSAHVYVTGFESPDILTIAYNA
jgi:hypothetical protein